MSLRKKEKIKVRQPLQKLLIPALTPQMKSQIEHVATLIQSEVNVKEIEYLEAKNIKKTYMIENMDDSDSEFDAEIDEVSESELEDF